MNRPPRRAELWRTLLLAAFLLATHLLAGGAAPAQEPLIEVRFPSTDTATLVRARLNPQGALELPREPLETLTGESLSENPWLTLPELRRALGGRVEVAYDPRRAVVVIRDTYRQLAASRRASESRTAEVRATPGGTGYGGPWATAATDGTDASVRAGTTWWRLAGSASHSTRSGTRWRASLRPWSRTWVSYSDGGRSDPRLAVRASREGVFATAEYDFGTGKLRGRATAAFGPFTVFGSTRRTGGVGYRGDDFSVVVGRAAPDRYVTRVTVGARRSSTLTVPRIR